MNTYPDFYKHLNETSKFQIDVDIEEVATIILSMNYGMHRLLSALARQRLLQYPRDVLAINILALLEDGLY